MRIGIIGAGFAGLATAKVLTQVGHEVVVWDRTPDVGGVWSATRRYPGVTTQSPRDMYSLSDFPMPKSYPEWPTGAQVQQYLADYATHFGLDPLLRLNTEVVTARPSDAGWTVETRDVRDGSTATEQVDRLVVANGVFCEPAVPQYPGVDDFAAAGGRMLAATEFLDEEQARDKDVVVVGYGKSACDVAVAISETARSTSVIARQLLWKVPRRVGGVVNFKFLLLTRMGEALFRYRTVTGPAKFLHGPGNGIRRNMLNSVGSASVRQYKLKELDLVPSGTMEGIVRGAIGLVTDGFYEQVREGRDHRAREPHDPATAREGRPAACRARRRHRGARRPGGVRDRVHAGRAVPRPRRDDAAARRTRQLHAVPADPAAGRRPPVLRRLQLVVLQPAQRRDGRRVDRRAPGWAASRRRTPRRCATRWPSSSPSWTTRSTGTTATGRRSSRSRCTTSTRCSATST